MNDMHSQAETPMSDHVARFWKLLATEHVRILIDIRREHDEGPPHWDSSSFSDDVAKALVAALRQPPAQTLPSEEEIARAICGTKICCLKTSLVGSNCAIGCNTGNRERLLRGARRVIALLGARPSLRCSKDESCSLAGKPK